MRYEGDPTLNQSHRPTEEEEINFTNDVDEDIEINLTNAREMGNESGKEEDGLTFTNESNEAGDIRVSNENRLVDESIESRNVMEDSNSDFEKEEDPQIEELRGLYEEMAPLDIEQQDLSDIRNQLGINNEGVNSAESPEELDFNRLSEMEEKINQLEQDFLNSEDGGVLNNLERRDAFNIEEFKKIFENFHKAIEEAKEKYIEDATNHVVEKYRYEFDKAKNGKEAEELFRVKFPIFLRRALESFDEKSQEFTYVTEAYFDFVTLKGKGSQEDVFYVKKVDIKNKRAFFEDERFNYRDNL